jgi:hypothetical protein
MYKVFRSDCLDGLSFTCNRFDFDFELLGKLLRAGYRPLEIPVSYNSRGFEEGKKIRIFRDPITWVVAIIRSRFTALHGTGSYCAGSRDDLDCIADDIASAASSARK